VVGEPLTQRSRSRALRRRDAVTGYALLAPSLFGVACFLVLPVLIVVWLSFQSWDLIHPLRFAGLANYVSVLSDPVFGNALLVTAVFVVIVIPVQTALGLFGASLLTRGLPGSAVLRTIYALPWICAPLALGVVWKWIFAPTGGALNALLGVRVEWLTDPVLALPAAAAVVIWTNVGYVTLFFLAGLLNIPNHIVEAARIDGAGPASLFRNVTLPGIAPVAMFVVVTSTIGSFQLFELPYALLQITQSPYGPKYSGMTLVGYLYMHAFENGDLGTAAAVGWLITLIILIVSLIQIRMASKFGRHT